MIVRYSTLRGLPFHLMFPLESLHFDLKTVIFNDADIKLGEIRWNMRRDRRSARLE
jgi:hypothetical protein